MRKVAFTGTRAGMSEAQWLGVAGLIGDITDQGKLELHHGCCVGADCQAHEIALRSRASVVRHPSEDPSARVELAEGEARPFPPRRRGEHPSITRDHVMVDECERVIAAPHTFREQLRSGTWATIRYALRQGKPVTIVWPDGRAEARGE